MSLSKLIWWTFQRLDHSILVCYVMVIDCINQSTVVCQYIRNQKLQQNITLVIQKWTIKYAHKVHIGRGQQLPRELFFKLIFYIKLIVSALWTLTFGPQFNYFYEYSSGLCMIFSLINYLFAHKINVVSF